MIGRGQRADAEGHPPDQVLRQFQHEEEGDDRERQHLADREHQLPAIAHHLALAGGHEFHDVGEAVRDVAAERDAEHEADQDEHQHRRRERLQQGEHHEHDHRGQEDRAPSDAVGKPAADERADDGAALRRGAGEAEHERGRVEDLTQEDEHEGDRVEVPRLDQHGGDHQPAGAPPARTVIRDQMFDRAVDRRGVGRGDAHACSLPRRRGVRENPIGGVVRLATRGEGRTGSGSPAASTTLKPRGRGRKAGRFHRRNAAREPRRPEWRGRKHGRNGQVRGRRRVRVTSNASTVARAAGSGMVARIDGDAS